MKFNRKTTLALSLFISLLSTFLLWQKIRHEEEKGKAKMKRVRIVVAGKDIAQGDAFSIDNLQVVEILENDFFPRMLREEDYPQIEGGLAKNAVRVGNPINWDDVENPIELERFSLSIEKGKRALSIPADQQSTFSGMLRPGDHVDIFLTEAKEFESQSKTILLLENVTVSAIDSDFTETTVDYGEDRSPESVTVLVTGLQAVCLLNAMANPGKKLGVVLRNPKELTEKRNKKNTGFTAWIIEVYAMGKLDKKIRVRGK